MTSTANSPVTSGVALDRTVDLLVSLLLAGSGLLASIAGLLSYLVADRELSVRIVTELPVHASFLTEAELVDAVHQFMVWGGLGLAVAGLAVSAAGAGFLVYRTRLRRRVDHDLPTGVVSAAIVGAAVTGFTSVLPFSAVVGGGAAGYLNSGSERSGVAIGALAGLAASIPVVVFVGGLAVGAGTAGLPLIAGGLFATAFVSVLYFCGLSALGGLVGRRLAARA